MFKKEVLDLINNGESSNVEFKDSRVNPISLAEEIVAFANFEGGLILIGVSDNGIIAGCNYKATEEFIINICRNNITPSIIPSISKIKFDELEILLLEIPKGDTVYSTIQGKYFIRVGSTKQVPTQQELLRLFQKRKMIQLDEMPVLAANIKNISTKLVDNYLERVGLTKLNDESEEALKTEFINLSILSSVDTNHPSLAGYLIFSSHPQKIFHSFYIAAGAYDGTDIIGSTIRESDLTGTLQEMIEDAIAFLKLTIPKSTKIVNDILREEHYLYPIAALREAVVNAVAHRDYSIIGSSIRIFVFSNRVEIRSPGGLCNTLTLESLPYRQFARNQNIVSFLSGMGYMERRGKGILKMQKLSNEYGIKCSITITADKSEFVVTFSM